MSRRRVALGFALALCGSGVAAQSAWRSVAVPFYQPGDIVQGQRAHWYLPRAQDLARSATALEQAVQARCAGAPAAASRAAWRDLRLAWLRLATVPVGPLLERRSARRIDFAPARPARVARAIEQAPVGEAAMERVGSAAKGFDALRGLLAPAALEPAACAYAVEVAADLQREAQALAAAFAEGPDGDEAQLAAWAEAVNQWVGGLEQLRVQGFERGGAGADEIAARWAALRTLAVSDAVVAPEAGAGLVPLETVLRGKGLNPLADWLVAEVRTVGLRLDAARRGGAAAQRAASRALAALARRVEAEVAPALDVRLGFTDADGD